MKTMKKYLGMAALALVGAMTVSCSSDDNIIDQAQQPENQSKSVTLTTTIGLDDGGTTRALTETGVKTFGEGDKIAVIYKGTDNKTKKVESVALTEGDITNEGKSATFTVTLEAPKASSAVRYIYPAAMAAETVATSTAVTDDATINYAALASQDGTLDNLASKYDLAVFDGSLTADATLPASSTLTNQLAILAYTIKNAGGTSDLTNTITRLTVSDGPNTYGVTRTAADGPVYIAIRPTSSATISIMATTGTTTYTKSLASKSYAANNIYKAGLKMTEVPGAIPGMFSTSSSGGKVYFSKGNLYYDANATTKWYFATNQYDYIETATGYPMDHFTWGNIDSPTYNGTTYYTANADLSGTYDWGSRIGTGWRTLTGGSGGEWQHLFNTRTVNGGTGSGKSYTLGKKVNNVLGLVLYPDDYTGDEYSGSDWSTFESAGCVFLPAAGYRYGASVGSDGLYGYYWSSTANGAGYAYYAGFSSDNVYPASNNYRDNGILVRLVKDAN